MTAVVTCRRCGGEPRAGARFCDACGAPIDESRAAAEYKQVTVLFADVVRSMDIASSIDTERLREVMAEVFDRCAGVVRRYGGTVSQFTGDGIMAVFGAPNSLEDHAFRACLTALDIQSTTRQLAADVQRRDDITLQLRIGLNSGQVIAGEIGSSAGGYTTIGKQVGMAQRMESVAPADGVMLSESTARLVENAVVLGEPELVHVKGADRPVPARRLLAVDSHESTARGDTALVGRARELQFLASLLDEAIDGAGAVIHIVGPPGIGKSRLARECTAIAAGRGVAVFVVHCESHATDVPFHVLARLLRAGTGIEDLDAAQARARVRAQFADADPDDLLLLDDLLGIGDFMNALPDIAADARRRRLTALINAAALGQSDPAVYLIEDVHWIDEVSESLLAEFLAVIPQTPSQVLITSRPEYHGALTRVSGAQTVALRPLTETQGLTLVTELLGADTSLGDLAFQISARAAGNPFFAEEMVRDLAERRILHGRPGEYQLRTNVADVDVPATLQATIGARIDRLSLTAKHTLNAASVIGSRFDSDLLASAIDDFDIAPLIEAELIDQVRFGRRAEYAFRNPVVRAVAYESQLKSNRAQLHRSLAVAIENRDRAAADENAALIAEHLQAAGDLHAAYSWHMRAGAWLTNRDIAAARSSWNRAREIADRLPIDDPNRVSMRIASRAPLCGTAFRITGGAADTGFDELRDLCAAAGDMRSLAMGMNGLVTVYLFNARRREMSRLADELVTLLESIGDPTLTTALAMGAVTAKHETGQMADVLRIAQWIIDLADGDLRKGDLFMGSPVTLAHAMRGAARLCFGIAGWRDDLRGAIDMARSFDPLTIQAANFYTYVLAIPYGALLPDATAVRETTEVLAIAEQSADDLTLFGARAAQGIVLVHREGDDRQAGLEMLAKIRERGLKERFSLNILPVVDVHIAREKTRTGDVEGAVTLARSVLDSLYESGGSIWTALATTVLVEALLKRGGKDDLHDADAVIDQLAGVPTDPGFVLHTITLLRLRALLAQAQANEAAYRDYRDRYRKMASELGFEGHMAWAEVMP